MKVFIDIETVADTDSPVIQGLLDSVEPDERLVDPAKIQASIDKKRSKILDEAALSPLTGKIICYSLIARDYDGEAKTESTEVINMGAINNEIDLLNKLKLVISTISGRTFLNQIDTIVSFNGKSFDIPFLITRCAIHGIESMFKPSNRYELNHHFDIRSALTNFDQFGKGTLTDWCRAFGIKLETAHIVGSDISKLWKSGKYQDIKDKCLEDVNLMYKLYYRIANYYI